MRAFSILLVLGASAVVAEHFGEGSCAVNPDGSPACAAAAAPQTGQTVVNSLLQAKHMHVANAAPHDYGDSDNTHSSSSSSSSSSSDESFEEEAATIGVNWNRRTLTLDSATIEETAELGEAVASKTLEVMMEVLSVDFCWRTTKSREYQLASCQASETPTPVGLRCYRPCPSSYPHRNGANCYQSCPSGSQLALAAARCDFHPVQDTARVCQRTGLFGVCTQRAGCPSGWETWPYRCKRASVAISFQSSPSVEKSACPNTNYPLLRNTLAGRRCFQPETTGFDCESGDPAICWAKCPSTMQVCGLGMSCGVTTAACATNIGDMALSTVMAAASTAAIIASWGTAAAGGTQATKTAVSSATRTSFKNAAKANLASFKTKLAKEVTKEQIKTAVKEQVKQSLQDFTENAIEAVATEAVIETINNFNSKNTNDMDTFPFDSFDPTGLTTAIVATVDGGSRLDTAQAWVNVAGAIDPTGWISAGASFMHPLCEDHSLR